MINLIIIHQFSGGILEWERKNINNMRHNFHLQNCQQNCRSGKIRWQNNNLTIWAWEMMEIRHDINLHRKSTELYIKYNKSGPSAWQKYLKKSFRPRNCDKFYGAFHNSHKFSNQIKLLPFAYGLWIHDIPDIHDITTKYMKYTGSRNSRSFVLFALILIRRDSGYSILCSFYVPLLLRKDFRQWKRNYAENEHYFMLERHHWVHMPFNMAQNLLWSNF